MAKLIRETFDWKETAAFEGDAAVSSALLDLPFDHIFFTGSPAIGKVVMAAAAKHLAAVTLELGGKSPVIVDESADIAKAAKSIAWGKFTNCGQTCIAPDYAFVHESRMPQFIEAMKESIAKMYSDPARSPDYCRIINGKHFARISHLIEDAAEHGATILAGGERDEAQKFIAPTLLTGAGEDAAIMREEIFGPVLPVLSYQDLAEPIAAINARPKPLALYVYAKNFARVERMLRETSAGGSCVNASNIQFSHDNLPFGGIGNSGLGNAHGFYGFRAFSHERAVLEDKFSIVPMVSALHEARRGTLLFGQGRLWLEMFQKHDQSVADLAELLAVARNIRQHVGLDIRLARLAEVDYEAELAPDRTKKRRPRVDRLNDVAGQRQFEYRHASSPMI